MKADPLSLFEEFIKGAIGSQYVIPVYQRNYTWKKHKQVQQLLEDIKKILNHETSWFNCICDYKNRFYR